MALFLHNDTLGLVIFDGIEIQAGTKLTLTENNKIGISDDYMFITLIFDAAKTVWVEDDTNLGVKVVQQAAIDLLKLPPVVNTVTTTTPNTSTAFPSYALLRDVRPLGEDGGTARKKEWNVRVVNEITYDSDNITTLVGDDFTLTAGVFKLTIKCPAKDVDLHKIRLVNETTNLTEFEGTAVENEDGGIATAKGVIISDGTGVFEIQHYTKDKAEEDGLGEASKVGDGEVYTTVEIVRIG